jgi:tryptophan-rich sensory protein
MQNALKLAGCLLLTLLTGGISGWLTFHDIATWYATLHKPFFNQPNYLFGPVWSAIYTLMGVSFYLILKQPSSGTRKKAISIFIVQLVLNFFWSIIFFNFHFIGAALIEILAMWVSILLLIIYFYRVSKLASLIQLPYLCWVSFATLLNAAIFYLN